MKCLLSIGTTQWVFESASAAAKVADLLGAAQEVQQVFEVRDPELYIERGSYAHNIKVEQVTPKMLFTKSQGKVDELKKASLENQKRNAK